MRYLPRLAMLVAIFTVSVARAAEFEVMRFDVEGENPLSQKHTDEVLAPFLGVHTDISRLEEARGALAGALQDKGFTFYRVYLPQQKLNDGTITFRVTPFQISTVVIEGNEFYSEENILYALPALEKGTAPNTKDVSRNLAVMNRNPGKRGQITFAAGDAEETLKARVTVRDQKPNRFFIWGNNTGTKETGDTRLGLGFQHANLFNRDHALTATYANSPEDIEKVAQYGLVYQLPSYRTSGIVNLLAARSDIDTGTVAGAFDVAGKGDVYAARYTQLFSKQGAYAQSVDVAIADKLFDNDVNQILGDIPIGVDVRSRPINLRYAGRIETEGREGGFFAGYGVNLGGGSFNNDLAYAATRLGASSDWDAIYGGADLNVQAKEWLLKFNLVAQHGGEPLIPGEQFGVGGVSSVRGFEEREVTGDNGYQFNFEAWAPFLRAKGVSLLAFFDYGHVTRENNLPGELKSESISSVGVGLRWSWRQKLSVLLDWGYVVQGRNENIPGATQDGDNKIHFNVAYQF